MRVIVSSPVRVVDVNTISVLAISRAIAALMELRERFAGAVTVSPTLMLDSTSGSVCISNFLNPIILYLELYFVTLWCKDKGKFSI
jgi:hypothetical protein